MSRCPPLDLLLLHENSYLCLLNDNENYARMTNDEFFYLLSEEVKTYKSYLETDSQDWIVKGFIDVNKNVYTISNDTKVISKIIEILLIPKLDKFARDNDLKMELASKQNFYPDLTFKDNAGNLFAVDLKSSYYSGDSVNGLTLGSYWGYFRDRDVVKNMDYTYNSYASHTVLGILYKQCVVDNHEKEVFSVDELSAIHSVIEKFIFFVQPKWKIASDIPGSGNTRNIGGITSIQDLINGRGPFSSLGEDVFNDYWMGYFNKTDAKNAGIGTPHYHNLKTYQAYLESQVAKLDKLKK